MLRWLSVTLVVVSIACRDAAEFAACAPLVPGVPVVAGPPETSDAALAGNLEEVWRVGSVDTGPDLAAPASFAGSASGSLAVVDYVLAEVIVFDSAGAWNVWGTRGLGPGELAMPVAAVWDGDRSAVYDIEHSKVVFFAESAPYGPDLPVNPAFGAPVVAAGGISMAAVRSDGSVILQYPLSSTGAGDQSTARLDVPSTAQARIRFGAGVQLTALFAGKSPGTPSA